MLSVLLLVVGINGESRAALSPEFNQLLDAVVRIDVREVSIKSGIKRFSASVGSDVILSAEELVLTNAHVASPDAVAIRVTFANLERVGATLVVGGMGPTSL